MFSIVLSVGLGQVMCEYDFYPVYFLQLVTIIIYIKSFCYNHHKKDVFVDIVDHEGFFEFFPKAEFISHLVRSYHH